ncbi:hypothetical protein P43SY_000549 [Pythium insidiosum]|uniref:NADPH--hemoprotein reductase n=1 Tax=Pythium insidiosum TaxID=114742 RepID=A0AAD5M0Q3_PYTIN|nr:hypothetical protein P43SY_000549 [Pythium insidiosum]
MPATARLISGVLWAAAVAVAAGPYDGWKPHAYCNDLRLYNASRITPLTTEQEARVESLVQVQIVSRHGARAPYAQVFCWDNGGNNPLEATWNCTPSEVMSQNIGYKSPTGYGRLYAKMYIDGGNLLNGTCRIGGLLPEGRQQHLLNGEFLRDAYVGDGPLKLFSSSDLKDSPRGSIYLRSDDEERTVGSGQALMDGLFPPDESRPSLDSMLTWNVKDYAVDYLAMNDRICPMMGYIANLSNAAPDFVRHRKDPATIKMEKDFYKRVGNFSWNSILECLSISRCNDLPLPPGVDEDLFTKVFSEVETREAYFLLYNDSWYAKVAMQPAVGELLVKLDAALSDAPDAPRLSVMMAHDSTIIPMLAAIQRQHWDRKWTPYAGMLIMELYKTKAKSHAVRLLFMGQPLRIPECADSKLTVCWLPQEKLLEYELSQQGSAKVVKPSRPPPRFNVVFLDKEPTPEQCAQMHANDRTLYRVARNELISQPYRTKDGAWRSVRHIDLHVGPAQHANVGDNASNIAVFVPNDACLVDRMLRHLQVDPDIVYTISPLVESEEPSKTPRPFEEISSVRDALTWSLDLVSTPRSSFLRQLAAYATDENEIATLTAPQAAETLKASRPSQPTTVADVFDLFPSVHIDFASFLQLAPYLSALDADKDCVRATFFQSSFVFPHQDRRPVMMISAGTGIAPFRAFLQDLEHEFASHTIQRRRAYLFYGCRRPDADFLYAEEIHRAMTDGALDELHVAFSDRPNQTKQHVQDAVAAQGALVARHLLEEDGRIFLCGSRAMGRAVRAAVLQALVQHGGVASELDAATFLSDRQRWITELW